VGDTVPHRILLEAAGLDSPATAYYSAVSRTVRELQKDRHRSLRVVRGQGYQVIAGKAHMESGEVHHTRARKSMGKALVTVRTTDLGLLSQDDRTLHSLVMRGMGAMVQVMNMQADKLAEHDEAIRHLSDGHTRLQQRTDEEMEELRRRMDHLEEENTS